MNVTIDLHLIIDGIRNGQSGVFRVRRKEDIPVIAHNWIMQIQRETGCRPTVIERVIVDGDKDITDLVREIDEAPISDIDLPF
jgi:hypothetical protein